MQAVSPVMDLRVVTYEAIARHPHPMYSPDILVHELVRLMRIAQSAK
jgi:hypothetical protein